MLCNRLQPIIISEQSPDQAAYRKGYSTVDHMMAITLLTEGCAEWNQKLWVALVDFEKAFGTVEHAALWKVLDDLGVDFNYIALLKNFIETKRQSSWPEQNQGHLVYHEV